MGIGLLGAVSVWVCGGGYGCMYGGFEGVDSCGCVCMLGGEHVGCVWESGDGGVCGGWIGVGGSRRVVYVLCGRVWVCV